MLFVTSYFLKQRLRKYVISSRRHSYKQAVGSNVNPKRSSYKLQLYKQVFYVTHMHMYFKPLTQDMKAGQKTKQQK